MKNLRAQHHLSRDEKGNLTISTSSTAITSTCTTHYAGLIPYRPPPYGDVPFIASCGLYGGSPTGNTPIGTFVPPTFYAILKGTASWPKQYRLNVLVSLGYPSERPNFINTTVLLVPTQGNSTVLAGSVSFDSQFNGNFEIGATLPQIPEGCVCCTTSVRIYFNMGTETITTTETYANNTIMIVR